MFLHCVVLGSTVVVALASSQLQTIVDDADAKTHGATKEPLADCPATVIHEFQHDGMQKDQRAHATFFFDPPHDGCYLVEEFHPLLMCDGSKNAKVHVHYCKGKEAMGTVDQTTNGGDWSFLGALQFYKGIRGNVTLSNEGTLPGTLTVFDQVRFTWTAASCMEVDAHPRRAEIRIEADFQNVAKLIPEYKRNLASELAHMAHIPHNSVRAIDLRPGSIIAEFIVLPGFVDGLGLIDGLSPQQTMQFLGDAVAKNAAHLCTLVGGPLPGCTAELKDLGFAIPTIRRWYPSGQPEQQLDSTSTQQQTDSTQDVDSNGTGGDQDILVIVIGACAAVMLLVVVCAAARFEMHRRSQKTKDSKRKVSKDVSANSSAEVNPIYSMYEVKVSPETEDTVKGEPVKDDDDNSTLCPSSDDKQSDNQSEQSESRCVAVAAKGRGSGKAQRAVMDE